MVQIRQLKPVVNLRPMSALTMPRKPLPKTPAPKLRRPSQRYAGAPRVRQRFFKVIERRREDWPPPTPQPTPCILWQGSLDRDGYGRITKFLDSSGNVGRRQLGVHRHIMEVYLGRVLRRDEVVLHACDNRVCYRIDHLSIGTTQDNTADMVAKGRNSKPPVNVFHGSAHPMAKVSEQVVAHAKQLYANGHNQKQVAEIIGLSKSQTQRILRGQAWSGDTRELHVNDPRTRKEGSQRWTVEKRQEALEQGFVPPRYR